MMDIAETMKDMQKKYKLSAHLSRIGHPHNPHWCAETTCVRRGWDFTIRSKVSAADALVKLALCLQHAEHSEEEAR